MLFSTTTLTSTLLLATTALASLEVGGGAGIRQGHALAPQKHARAARAVSGVLSKKAKDAAASEVVPVVEKREEGDIEKRGMSGASGARMTYYDTSVGLGSCGEYHAPSEYTVALNSGQLALYGGQYPSPACGKMITITYNGKSTQASIRDECPTCPWGGLDLSEGLFTFFASTDVGVFYADWSYGSGAPAPPPPPPKPTTTWTPPPEPKTTWKPTTTWTPPAPTTTWTPEPTPTTPTSTWTPPTTTWTPPTTSSSVYTPPTTSSTSTSEYVPPTTSATSTSSSASSSSVSSSSSASSSTGSSSSSASSSAASSSTTSASSTGTENGDGSDSSSSSSSGSSTSGSASKATANPNNLANIASLTDLFGQVVCAGNPSCA